MKATERTGAIERAITFLQTQQAPSGEFAAYVARDESLQAERRLDHTPFVTTYVTYSLGRVQDPRAAAMRERALDFLGGEMEPPGVWHYWAKSHENHLSTPPDVDDTCCVAYLLRESGRPVPPIRRLLLSNRDYQERFFTWFVPRPQATAYLPYWRVTLRQILRLHVLLGFYRLTEAASDDVDGVVNANVLLYLGSCPEAEPVAEYLRSVLEAGNEATCDKWYLSSSSFYYAVSRAYAEGVKELEPLRSTIVRRISDSQRPDGSFGNATETALKAAALVNFDAPGSVLEAAVNHLLATQQSDGSWQAHALYFGGPKRYYGWGSEALTTALCVEVLAGTLPGEEEARSRMRMQVQRSI